MQNSNAALPGVPNTPALLLLSRRKVKRRGIIRLHSYPTLRLPKEVGRIGCRKKEKNEVRLLNIVTGIKIRELWMLRSIYLLEIDWIYNWIANSCNIHTIWFCLLEKIKNKKNIFVTHPTLSICLSAIGMQFVTYINFIYLQSQNLLRRSRTLPVSSSLFLVMRLKSLWEPSKIT